MGSLSILNAGAGDIKLSYDNSNVAEAIRAKRMIEDMMKRGYALLVEDNGVYTRATAFDSQHGEYIIADYEPQAAATTRTEAQEKTFPDPTSIDAGPSLPKRRGRPAGTKRVSMEKVKAVGVARSAGG